MKFKEYNPENSSNIRTSLPSIAANIAAGRFTFSKTACEFLKLQPGVPIKFFKDEEDPICWYIAVCEGGFNLRSAAHSSLIINAAKVVKELADANDAFENFSLLIAGQPTIYNKMTLYGIMKKPTA